MISKLAQSFVILSSLAVRPSRRLVLSLMTRSRTPAAMTAPTPSELLPIPDQEGHTLMLTESTGSAVHPGGPLDGFSAVTREIADLRQGSGLHEGYVVFSKGDDQQVVRFEGTVTTTIKDGKPNTTMKGAYAIIGSTGVLAGRADEGTYAGYFTAEDKYQLNWDGHMTPQRARWPRLARTDSTRPKSAFLLLLGPLPTRQRALPTRQT